MTDRPHERPRSDGYAEGLMLTAGLFGTLAMSALSPALPKIQHAFAGMEGADYLTKLVVSAVGIAMVIASPAAGAVVRRLGRRRTLLLSYVLFLVAGVGGTWVGGLWGLIASRFLVGVSGALIVTTGITLIGDFHNGRPRERRIGANHAIGALMLSLLVPVAGYLADQDWRLASLVHLIALPGLIATLMSPSLGAADRATAAEVQKSGGRPPPLPTTVYMLCALTVATGCVAYSLQVFLPFHLRDVGLASSALAGLFLSLSVFCSVFTSFVYAELRRFASPAVVFLIAYGGWGLALGMLALSDDIVSFAVAMIVMGIAGGLVGPNIFSIASGLTGEANRARVVGVTKGCYYFGPFLGPTLLQPISHVAGAQGALLAMSVMAATLGIICLMALLTRRGLSVLGSAPVMEDGETVAG